MTRTSFVHDHPAPVLVARSIVGGRLGRARRRGGANSRALRTRTLVHIEPMQIPDPREDDIMITRPLKREMWVRVQKGPGTPRSRPITVGRSSDCDVVINDYTISKEHAHLLIDPLLGRFRLVDLGSTNGTLVGDTEVEPGVPIIITSGQWITLGRLNLVLLSPEDFFAYLTTMAETSTPTFDLRLPS